MISCATASRSKLVKVCHTNIHICRLVRYIVAIVLTNVTHNFTRLLMSFSLKFYALCWKKIVRCLYRVNILPFKLFWRGRYKRKPKGTKSDQYGGCWRISLFNSKSLQGLFFKVLLRCGLTFLSVRSLWVSINVAPRDHCLIENSVLSLVIFV